MATKLVWGSDLYKGTKLGKNEFLSGAIHDHLPWQMLSLEEKTIDWIKAVADFHETTGWNNVERKAGKIQRNYWMRYGKLNPSDYIINPEINPLSEAIGMILPPESQSPLQMFYPIAPNFVDVMRGEFLKKDNTWTIEAIDEQSKAEMFQDKEGEFKQTIMQMVEVEKQQTLAGMGITEETDPEQYMQEMQATMDQLTNIEMKYKNFRTTGARWAKKVLKIHDKRYNLQELEPDAFECGLISDSEFWHLDLLDDDFKLELLNPKYCDYHKGPNIKYVSDGDYFLWFDFMSIGDIVNKFGRRIKEEDLKKLKEIYAHTSNIIVPDHLKGVQGSYYDRTKSWDAATEMNPVINDVLLGKELAYNFTRSPNFDHNIDTNIFSPGSGRMNTGHPQMYRVMRLYWRSLRRVGWLTKIHRDGTREQPTWIDENFKVTIEPVYDQSVVKEKSKDNLLYGEHIDWTWAPEWRHLIKISPNQKHAFWVDSKTEMEAIYIDGAPVKFQFKGRENPFDSLPPVEGCIFSYINSTSHSFIDRLRPTQVLYNICMNKVPRKFLEDKGLKIAVDRRSYSTNNLSNNSKGVDPREEYEDRLDNSQILEYSFTRESLEGLGQPALPTVLNLSTAQEAQFYFNLGRDIKFEAGEIIGISRNKLGGSKASETATGIENNIVYSDTQVEKYYEQHSNLMERVRQRMLDAAQFYTTFSENAREIYMNDRYENVFIGVEGLKNLTAHYNIYLESRANVRAALRTASQFLMSDNTIPMKGSAKIEALVENSLPKVLDAIRKGELEQELAEQAKMQQEQAQFQADLEARQEAESQKLAYDAEQAQLDRESQERIAEIRALGGLQSDNNADGRIDAQQNLDNFFREQEIKDKRSAARDATNTKRQTDIDKMLVEREKAQKDLEGKKYVADKNLQIAKENKNPAELGKTSKK